MKRTTIIMISAMLVTPVAHAHEGHVHEAAMEAAPHGGTLRNVEPYKAEAVINGDVVRIYVYDKFLKPVTLENSVIEGNVQFPRQKHKRVEFKRKEGFYEGTIKGISRVHRYDLHVNLNADGKVVIADFGIDNLQ